MFGNGQLNEYSIMEGSLTVIKCSFTNYFGFGSTHVGMYARFYSSAFFHSSLFGLECRLQRLALKIGLQVPFATQTVRNNFCESWLILSWQ